MLWRYPNRTALEPGVRLLPEVLKKAGYQTCHIGKWHVTENPLQNGMDINIAGNHIGHPKSYFSPYGMEIWKNGPEGEFLMIGYFFRVGCFWHKNFLILCYSWWWYGSNGYLFAFFWRIREVIWFVVRWTTGIGHRIGAYGSAGNILKPFYK